jgi:hypothetical protein
MVGNKLGLSLILILCVACGTQANQTQGIETPISPPSVLPFEPQLPAQLKPGDEFVLSGEGSARSETFPFPETSLVRLNWTLTTGQDFSVIIENAADETDRVQFALKQGPGEGSGDWIFPAGSYSVVVNSQQGEWRISMTIVEYRDSPFTIPIFED